MRGITGGMMSVLENGSINSGFLSGAISSLVASGVQGLGTTIKGTYNCSMGDTNPSLLKATMIVAGGLSGGISATIAGGNFWQGFRQGLITAGLNHVAHMTTDFIQRETRQSALQTIKKEYPKFYEVLTKLTEFLEANPKVLSTLAEDTGLTKEQVLNFMDIKSPEGQIIKAAQFVLKDPKQFRFGQSGYPNSYINVDLIKTFETLQTPAFIQGTSFLLAVTVMHEFVHWGRSHNSLPTYTKDYESGSYWEMNTFGMDINKNSAYENYKKFNWKI